MNVFVWPYMLIACGSIDFIAAIFFIVKKARKTKAWLIALKFGLLALGIAAVALGIYLIFMLQKQSFLLG